MNHTRSHTAAGFSLLELLVVGMLSAGLALVTAQFWQYYSRHLKDLSARARSAQELRFAVESVARDMGSAVGAIPLTAESVLLCRDGGAIPNGAAEWGAPDSLVTYALVSGQLVRREESSGVQVVIADRVGRFAVEDLTASVLQIAITVECGGASREACLLWSRP